MGGKHRTDRGKHWLNKEHNPAFLKFIGGYERLKNMSMGQLRKAHIRWKKKLKVT